MCYADNFISCQVTQATLTVIVADWALYVLLTILLSRQQSLNMALRNNL